MREEVGDGKKYEIRYWTLFLSKVLILSGNSIRGSFETGSSTKSKFDSGFSNTDTHTSKSTLLSHLVFAALKTDAWYI